MRLRLAVLGVLAVLASVLVPTAANAAGPSAVLSASPDPTTSGETVYFSGYNSCCTITNYQFDFGDGNSVSSSYSYAHHTYYNYGTTQKSFTVRMTVTDSYGASTTTTLTEYVNPDYAPVAELALSPNPNDSSGLSIYADASASTDDDVDGFSPPYYFDFDFGDGNTASSYNSGVVGHKYATAGTYSVTVRVYDTEWNSDAQSRAEADITVPGGCGTSCVTRPNPPSETTLRMLMPATVTTTGAFPIRVVVIPPVTTPVSICAYQFDRAVDGAWATVATQSSTTFVTHALAPGSGLYQYRVWSIGCNGTKSAIATASTAFHPTIDDQYSFVFRYRGYWRLVTAANAYGGKIERTTTVGASASFGATMNNFGIVARRSPAGGKITVYVDGVLKGRANLYAGTLKERQIVFKWGVAPPTTYHTVRVVLTGVGFGGGRAFPLDAIVAIGG